MKKYSILTFIFKDYELLRDPVIVDPECEYVCVTDNPDIKSEIWKIRPFKADDPIYGSFYVRWHPFEFVDTKVCIILDASVKILGELNKLYTYFYESKKLMAVAISHSQEAIKRNQNMGIRAIHRWKKRNKFLSESDYQNLIRYIERKWKNIVGYFSAGFRISLKDKRCQKIETEIWEACLSLGSNGIPVRIDEIPFSVILQNTLEEKDLLFFDNRIFESILLQICEHHEDTPVHIKTNPDFCFFKTRKVRTHCAEEFL